MNTTPATNSAGEAIQDLCSNGTEFGCSPTGAFGPNREVTDDFLEREVNYGLRLWHIIFLSTGAVLSLIILLCCCVKFRIPRTKQEIEADYKRRKLLKKFSSRLKAIQNQELDEMNLKRALDKVRAELKSDTESLAQSEAGFSVGTISSSVLAGERGHHSSTYRRASQIAIDISLEDLRAHSMGVAGRLSLAFSKFFGRSKVGQTTPSALAPAPTDKSKVPPPPPLPGKAKNDKSEKPSTVTIDETKRNPKKPAGDNKEKASNERENVEAKKGGGKPESKVKDAEKSVPASKSKPEVPERTKKAKIIQSAPSAIVEVQPQDVQEKEKGQAKNVNKAKEKEDTQAKKDLEKEKKKEKERIEKDKKEKERLEKEQAKREKMNKEKEKFEKAKQEKEQEKLEKQKQKEKLDREKLERESKKQKEKSEKSSKKGKPEK